MSNLFLTCLVEEAFFRGYVQRALTERMGVWPALGVAAGLFGLAHVAGGLVVVFFAALAGLGYGIAYRFGGGLTAAVLMHFGFNLTHLLLFTYPVAA